MLTAARILLVLGACEHAPCVASDVDARALLLVEACGIGPTEAPHGEQCVRELAVLFYLEARLQTHPRDPDLSDCGPLQVLHSRRVGSSRPGYTWTPPCETLQLPQVGMRWGLRLLRWRARLGRSFGVRAAAFNGRRSYGRRALRLLGRVP